MRSSVARAPPRPLNGITLGRGRLSMPEPISPWNDSADRTSPDSRFRAIIVNACEVGMGAPTSGMLSITEIADNGRVIARFEN